MSVDFLKIFGLSFMLMISPIHAASDFEFENIDGGVLNLQEFRGSPVSVSYTHLRAHET